MSVMNAPTFAAVTPRNVAPGPPNGLSFGVGVLRQMRRDPVGFLTEMAWKHGDIVRLRIGRLDVYLLSHPDYVRHVLQDNSANYNRETPAYQKMRMALGQGLFTSDGEFWRRQRRIAQPAFHKERIAHFASIMTEMTQAMVERWRSVAADGHVTDVESEMVRLTMGIVGRTLFSTDVSRETDEVGGAAMLVQEHIAERITRLVDFPDWVPTPSNLRCRKALGIVDRILLEKIAERRAGGQDAGDLLSMLMQARDEQGGGTMSDTQLRDEMVTMFSAGHETTAVALTWAWYLISKNPTAARRLFAELDEVLEGRLPTLADIPRLEYTTLLIKEAMRLFPPVWVLSRRAIQADVINGFHVPAGSVMILSPYVTHRRPQFWDNPEGFDPERFLPERLSGQPRFAYLPFGGGPHQCIGNAFAMMEAQLIVATVAQQCRLSLVPGHPVDLEPLLSLRPKHGMNMTIQWRGPLDSKTPREASEGKRT